MPISGIRKSATMGRSYDKDPMYKYAQAVLDTAKNITNESTLDLFEDIGKCYRRPSTHATLENFFVEGSYDPNPEAWNSISEMEDFRKDMKEMFMNDIEGMNEAAAPADYNPIIAMTTPIHKNILMNMVYGQGAIPTYTAVSPKFTETMEFRKLVTPDGTEIDMFTEQNKMTAAIDATNPDKMVEFTLPEQEQKNVIVDEFGGSDRLDNLDIYTHIAAVKVSGVYIAEGDVLPDEDGYVTAGGKRATADEAGVKDVWYRVNIPFQPGYGSGEERRAMKPIQITYKTDADGNTTTITDTIAGCMKKNKFQIASMFQNITAVRVLCRLDTSNAMLDTCSVKWDTDTTLVEIGNSIPISTTISPNEVKDIAALYNVNQLTKYMSMFKTAMLNYKDDKIKQYLDDSWSTLDRRSKGYGVYDYVPTENYALDHLEYRRKTFFDFFDRKVTEMFQVLNDPNMVVTAWGDPDLVRRLTPTDITYSAPSSIGPVELDFTKHVATSDKRTYQFIGSDKLRGSDEFTVILCPRNTDRIIYRLYNYQMYISNEIRSNSNPALPNIHAFERWRMFEYQPIQSRIRILHPSGIKNDVNEDPAYNILLNN